jgi:hypothetical protein
VISDARTAEYVSKFLLDVNGQLNESIAVVERSCSAEEFVNYRRRVGTLINSIFESILEPIYLKHPTLKPSDLEM